MSGLYQKQYAKVNWINGETLPSGFKCEVSEKSGLVKITFPGTYHTVMLFRDHAEALCITNPEVMAYFERNAHVIKASGENKQAKKLSAEKQKLIKAVADNAALTDAQKQAMIAVLAA